MRYIELILYKLSEQNSQDRPLLVVEHYRPVEVFDHFIREFVANRVADGAMRQHERYRALIIPLYSDAINPALRMSRQFAWPQGRDEIDLDLDGAPATNPRMRAFTLKLLVVERSFVLMQDFSVMAALRQVYTSRAVTYVEQGFFKNHDQFIPLFYAHDDEHAEFARPPAMIEPPTRERVDVSHLIELLPDDDTAPSRRSLRDYPRSQVVGTVDERTPLRILISEQALGEMREVARSSVREERGGMLVGNAYGDADLSNGYLVEVRHQIHAENAQGSHVHLRYTVEDWQRQTSLLQERYPGQVIVGWYHSHLIKMPQTTAEGVTIESELFFSKDDLFIHSQFFREPWHIAIVLNPQGEQVIYYWRDGHIATAPGYWRFTP